MGFALRFAGLSFMSSCGLGFMPSIAAMIALAFAIFSLRGLAMKKRLTYESIQQKAKYKIPAAHCREIGRVIVRWAYYEQYIQRLIWAIAFAADAKGAALGRLVVRETKPEEQLKLLAAVAKVRGVTMDMAAFARIKTKSKSLAEDRNLMAHGLWTDPIGAVGPSSKPGALGKIPRTAQAGTRRSHPKAS